MQTKPILFSAPMIRALLAGRKTQTRRLLNKPKWAQAKGWPERIMDEQDLDGRLKWFARETGCLADLPIPQPGDLLWVKETHYAFGHWEADGFTKSGLPKIKFVRLPGTPVHFEPPVPEELLGKMIVGPADEWHRRPSLFMFEADSRLTLRVTDVRVQRLQEISDRDALAEGVDCAVNPVAGQDVCIDGEFWPGGPSRMFRSLWDSLNAARAPWADNPWVAAYTFEVHQCNVDQMEAQ